MNRAHPATVKTALRDTLLTLSVFAGSFGLLLIAMAGVLSGG